MANPKSATSKSATKELPKTIYVKWEKDQNDPDDGFLIADETPNSMNDGDTVGVYHLRETKVMSITKRLT